MAASQAADRGPIPRVRTRPVRNNKVSVRARLRRGFDSAIPHMSNKFIKNVEDFECEHCGELVVGDGYTNHCPTCLWSKHVDIYPGDRANECGGLMCPKSLELLGGEYILTHQCRDCGGEKRNKTAKNDDISAFLTGML